MKTRFLCTLVFMVILLTGIPVRAAAAPASVAPSSLPYRIAGHPVNPVRSQAVDPAPAAKPATLSPASPIHPNSYTADDFVITINTGTTAPYTFTIPTTGSGYSYIVDCSNSGSFSANQTGNYECTYGASGTYTIVIRDNSGSQTGFPRIYFNNTGDKTKLLTIQQWGTGEWTSMNKAFFGCSNLTVTATDAPVLTGVSDMSYMFAGATLVNSDMHLWNTASVTNMSYLFDADYDFNQDIHLWNTANVTDMSYMFLHAHGFNQPLPQTTNGWNTANVLNMTEMFSDATVFDQDIHTWNTAKVTNMYGMFWSAPAFNQPLPQTTNGWNTAKVANMSYMFENASAFNQNLGSWTVTALTNATNMLYGDTLSTANYDALLKGWGVQTLQSGVTFNGGSSQYCEGAAYRAIMAASPNNWTITDGNMTSTCAANDFVITVNTANTGTGTSTSTQFTIPTYPFSTYNYNVDCNNDGTFEDVAKTGNYTCNYATPGTYTVRIQDNTGSLTGFPRIYFNNSGDAQKLLTIQQWGKGKWNSMRYSFQGCSNLMALGSDMPDLSNVTDMGYMFYGASVFNGNIGGWITSNVTDMSFMFDGASLFNQDISSWNTSKVTNMEGMFANDSVFNQPIGIWNTAQVTNMYGIFSNDTAFNQPIGGWTTSSVINMSSMFFGASAFNQPLNSWDTSQVTDMNSMFQDAANFNQDIGKWSTSKVTNMTNMFYEASAFDQNLGGWKVSALTNATNMFEGQKLSTWNYDALLQGWDKQTLQHTVTFSGGNSYYCAGAAARADMINTYTWSITDAGLQCQVFLPIILR